jgi:glycosyltransferase involved in cell wall biosynthesis
MKIAYISLHHPHTHNTGVGKKILRTMEAWRADGHEAKLFMHTPHSEPVQDLIPGEIYGFQKGNGLRAEIDRIRAARDTVAAIRGYAPEIIYLRYGIYVFPVHRLSQIAPVIEELNTNDIIEQMTKGAVYGFYNILTRGLVMRRVKGMVAISYEMAGAHAFAKYGKPIAVIANGIDLENFHPFPPPSNRVPRVVFIGTPSVRQSFHGIDKLVRLAKLCTDIQFDVIGYDKPVDYEVPLNVVFHGYLSKENYQTLLAAADIALASLALHRVGLRDGSPLKSREYLAYGLPTILPYLDTDLHDLECNFLLKIPNREDNVETHAEEIRDFIYRMRGRRADRAVFAERIDIKEKERKRLKFFMQFI